MGKYYSVNYGKDKNSLMHYGIPNMRWGKRRFQNEDGSLTPEGKERYSRGKEYSRERDRIADEKRDRLLEKDGEYQKAKRESDEASDEYNSAEDSDTRERAMYRKGQADAEAKRRYDKATERAMKHANSVITKKYGDKALSDIDHYKTESEKKFNKFVGGTLLALSVAAIGAYAVGEHRKVASMKAANRQLHDYVRNANHRF